MIDYATKSVDIKPLPWEAQSSFCLSLSIQSSDHNTWTVSITSLSFVKYALEIFHRLSHRNNFAK